jgi:hypothetical protein
MMKIVGLVLGALVLLPFSCGGGAAATGSSACHQVESAACDKAYECVAPADRDTDFTDLFGTSLADCKGALADSDCADADAQCPKVNSAKLSTCVSKTKGTSCPDFLDPAVASPEECSIAQICEAP